MSKVKNSKATKKNWIENLERACPTGEKPHSYEDNFSSYCLFVAENKFNANKTKTMRGTIIKYNNNVFINSNKYIKQEDECYLISVRGKE